MAGLLRYAREFSRWHVEKHLLRLLVTPDAHGVPADFISDTLLPRGWVTPDWICYCAGVGEDIEFERYVAERLGGQVWAFDPTPRSIRFMAESAHDRSRLRFVPRGLWKEDATLRFFSPANPRWVSHSVMEPLGGDTYFDAPCISISTAMRELGHERVDLLKMNIEGAEHVVLESALDAGLRPKVLTFTYEGSDALLKVRRWTARLRGLGYRLLGRRGWYFTYVRSAPTEPDATR